MQRVKDYISEQCGQSEEGDRVVTQSDIAEAIQHLNANKSDGEVGLMSNHLLLMESVTAFREYGYVSVFLSMSLL